jgi:HAE1 family hydrophobic/amphiphilic exporter-1
MIMASQFESLVYPFIVMFSMPLAITGGAFGLFVTGQSLTVTAYMGFIMLVGMVVNNAIVLVDYANQLRERKGLNANEALLEAGPSRLRPILMTTLTTIIGLMPMAFATSSGMETQQPLGIAVIFGLGTSTLITLILIPVLYSLVNSVKNIIIAVKNKIFGE